MSVDHLLNIVRAQAQMANGENTSVRVGQVTAYNPSKYAVRVKFWPDNVESSGWIPLLSPYIGAGWGLVAGPGIGDQVAVVFDREDHDAGIVVGRFFTDFESPPAAPSQEFWLVHKSGSFVKLTNDGKLTINGNVSINATAPTINITATGNVNVVAGGTATVQSPSIILKNLGTNLRTLCTSLFMTLYNGHTHNDPQGGATGVPNQQAAIGTHTTNIVQAE